MVVVFSSDYASFKARANLLGCNFVYARVVSTADYRLAAISRHEPQSAVVCTGYLSSEPANLSTDFPGFQTGENGMNLGASYTL